MNQQPNAAEPPWTVSLAETLVWMLGLLLFLLFMGPAITGWFSGFHVWIPGILGCLLGLRGMTLVGKLVSRKRSIQIQVFGFVSLVGAWAISGTVLPLIYGSWDDPMFVVSVIFSGVFALLAVSVLILMATKTARNWFR